MIHSGDRHISQEIYPTTTWAAIHGYNSKSWASGTNFYYRSLVTSESNIGLDSQPVDNYIDIYRKIIQPTPSDSKVH